MLRNSLQVRFTLVVVILTSSVLGVFGFFNYRSAKSERMAAIDQRMDHLANNLAGSLANPLWELNYPAVREMVDSVLSEPLLQGISVRSSERLVYGVQRNGQPMASTDAPLGTDEVRTIPIEFQTRTSRQLVGTVNLYLSFKDINDRQRQELWWMLLQLAILNLTVVLGMSWAMRRVVVRPIKALGVALATLTSDGADLSLRMSESGTVEFDQLIGSFNSFVQKLQALMGGSIEGVHAAIAKVASGDLESDLRQRQFSESSVMGSLAVMQANLRNYQEQEHQNAAQLKTVLQAATAASVAKSEFLANMSHEIRTPMNAIIGLSALALKNDSNPRTQDYLGKIKRSGEHLLGIVNDILDFSKIESGKMEIEAVPFVLDEVIDNMVNLVSEKVDAKGLELLCRVEPGVPQHLIGDPLRIGQILINLVGNAVKFTPTGDIQVVVGSHAAADGRLMLEVKVIDSGIGMSQAQIARLFKSFEQADASITRNYGGTGLGLAISKSLAVSMGGDAGVSSELGQGSTFWFTASVLVAADQTPLQSVSIDLHGSSVLVVDDNETSGLILGEMLSAMGFSVKQVTSGRDALQELQQADLRSQPYTFVLMDWLMPEMDGLQTIRAIQKLHIQSSPFVLMVTAHRRQELVKSALELGVAHVLAKPVNGSNLLNTMLQIVHQGQLAVAPAPTLQPSTQEIRLEGLRGARILLVEDNEINQQVATELLMDQGFEVDVAENGQLATHQVQARWTQELPYDLVLMDMQMPVMDGVTATRLIRENKHFAALPIVAMTANAMKVDRDRCLQAGMNDFVTKPIQPAELWRAILQWLPIRPGLGQAPAHAPEPSPGGQGPDSATDVALRNIAQLDVDLGLQRTGNKPAFYMSLLGKFVASQQGAANSIAASLAASDPATAERTAHTLMGVAGNLGAARLQHSAAALERLIREGSAESALGPALQECRALLDSLVSDLQAALPPVQDAPAATAQGLTAGQQSEAQTILVQLKQLLAQDDAAALFLWESHGQLLRQVVADATRVEEALQGYDFETAAALISAGVPK